MGTVALIGGGSPVTVAGPRRISTGFPIIRRSPVGRRGGTCNQGLNYGTHFTTGSTLCQNGSPADRYKLRGTEKIGTAGDTAVNNDWWDTFVERLRRRDPATLAALGGGVLVLILVIFFGTARRSPTITQGPVPPIPAAVSRGPNTEPRLKVYFHEVDRVIDMDIEDYLLGVVAAEMEPSWPAAALEAQAIIARTFTLQRIEAMGGVPRHNAHASTDHQEFQAYDSSRINQAVHAAIKNTRGEVLAHSGELARTWFHAYSGGQTATPDEGLGYPEPVAYLSSVVDRELDESIPDDVKYWSLRVPAAKLRAAAGELAGTDPGEPSSVKVAAWSDSGRAVKIQVNDVVVGGNDLRTALGADQFKSTMLKEIEVLGDEVLFAGKGFGHGVGLSQWGAKVMAEQKQDAESIVHNYYRGTYVTQLWS